MKQLSIIGLSGAGKTCYTYAMAKTMLKGYDGINAIAIDDDVREQLKTGWRQIRKGMTWPDGSDRTLRRKFNCSLNLESVMDFCWDDFKGGELTSMNEVAQKFRSDFNLYLKNSDGLILFVPADVYLDIIEETENADDLLDDLDCLNELFVKNKDSLAKIPVTIVITKADLLDDNSKKLVLDFIKELLPPLFQNGNNMEVLIVPVSLGVGLGRGKQGGVVKGEIYADPKKGNIHIPIVFNLYHLLNVDIAEAKADLKEISKDISKKSSRLSKAKNHNWLKRIINGEDIKELNDELEIAKSDKEDILANLRDIEKKLEKVKTLFTEDCQYFVDGNKAKL